VSMSRTEASSSTTMALIVPERAAAGIGDSVFT